MILVSIFACVGETTPDANPEPTTPPVEATPPTPAPAAAAGPDKAAVEALIPPGTPSQEAMDELAGMSMGKTYTTAVNLDIGPLHCAPGEVDVYDEQWRCVLAQPWTWNGHTFKAGTNLGLFYGTDTPVAIVLETLEPKPDEIEIAGIHCTEFIHLTPGGKLDTCNLAKPATVGAYTFQPGTLLALDEAGKPVFVTIFAEHELDGQKIPPGMVIFQDGKMTEHMDGVFGE